MIGRGDRDLQITDHSEARVGVVNLPGQNRLKHLSRRHNGPAWLVRACRLFSTGSVIFSISAQQHPRDFGGTVAPAQFWRTLGNDIE
jgi:hypothetical protein